MKALRPHQSEALRLLYASIMAGKRRPMVQMPTGAGKTVFAANLIRNCVAKGKRAIFTVPAVSLVDQTAREFFAEGIREVGVMQADHCMTDARKPVQVASVQTLIRRPAVAADLVIVDEAHRQFDGLNRWIEGLSCPVVGLSATPWSKGLGRVWDDLIIATTTAELIKGGYLSPFRVFAPSKPDLSGVKTVAGDYHEGQLAAVMGEEKLVADVVGTWLQRGEDRPTLVFAVDRAHAAKLQAQFQAAGVPAGYVDANTPREEREVVRKSFAAGEYRVVCNVGVLTTGVDWDVRCIVLARPTKSEILYVQMVGRGLRTADGKPDCTVLDHSSTTLNLGFVTDIHREKLCDGKPDKSSVSERKVRVAECSKCSLVRPAGISKCPSCGFEPVRPAYEPAAGELVSLDGARRASAIDREARRLFHRELMSVCAERGYKSGWAGAQFRERYGVWPDWAWKHDAPAEPSPATLGWLKSRQIAWAKRKVAA